MIEINNKQICESCFAEITAEPCQCCGFNKSTYISDPSVLPCGSILMGRYIVGKMLGKGGFGITYLAYDSKTDNTVAVKEFYPNGLAHRASGNPTVTVSTSEDASVFQNGAEKFYSEAKLVAKFNGNPGIVSVYEFFYENDTVYFSMEYLHGKTLKKHIDENGAITEAQAVSIADSVSSALLAAHSANVMHRDISPDNIMLCDDGTVKIIDFGAARQLVSQGSQNLSVILKQGFAPIEQYQKKGKQGPWTDIYSLGATLYYTLTLNTIDDPMSRMENDEDFQANKHGISEPLWEVIRKATMLKAADRYQDIFLFRNALAATEITPEPIIKPKDEVFAPGFTFQTAQPFNSKSASANTNTNVDANANADTGANTNTNADGYANANTNKDLAVTVAMDTPAAQKAAPVPDEAKADKKKIGIFIGIAVAAVLVLGIGTVLLVSALTKDDDIMTSGTLSLNDDVSYSQSEPDVSDPDVGVTSATTTTTRKPVEEPSTTPEPEPPAPPTESESQPQSTPESEPQPPAPPAEPESKPQSTPESEPQPPAPPAESESQPPAPPPTTTPATTTTTTTPKPPVESEPEEITEVYIAGSYVSVDTKVLDLSGRKLTSADLKNLQYMTSLTHINLSDNYIDDLSILGKVPTLMEIDANNLGVSDISFVKNLPNLGILIMNNNNITDISPLKNCKKLKKLWLVDNAVTDISALKGKELVELGLNNSPIYDISALKGMRTLTQLNLYNCGISDISALSTCISLKTVYLHYNYITDFSPLVGLQYLDVVYLDGNTADEESIKTLYGISFYSELHVGNMGLTPEMLDELCENTKTNNPDGAAICY